MPIRRASRVPGSRALDTEETHRIRVLAISFWNPHLILKAPPHSESATANGVSPLSGVLAEQASVLHRSMWARR
jgi:hypothetical protein